MQQKRLAEAAAGGSGGEAAVETATAAAARPMPVSRRPAPAAHAQARPRPRCAEQAHSRQQRPLAAAILGDFSRLGPKRSCDASTR